MHHAVLVRVRERGRYLSQKPYGIVDWKLTLVRQMNLQRLTLDKRHYEVGESVDLTGREQGNDVRMLKPGGYLDLALESLLSHPARHLLRQHLHDHFPAEILFLGQKQTAHA